MIHFRDGTNEVIEAGESSQALNYEIANMIKAIDGEIEGSIHLTTDVIDVLDQMQAFWEQQ